MRRKGLEPSQDKLPLEPESSASAIPPSPLTNDMISHIISFCKYFFPNIAIFMLTHTRFLYDLYPVHFQMLVNSDNKALSPVYLADFYKIRALRVDLYHYVRGFKLESLRVHDI